MWRAGDLAGYHDNSSGRRLRVVRLLDSSAQHDGDQLCVVNTAVSVQMQGCASRPCQNDTASVLRPWRALLAAGQPGSRQAAAFSHLCCSHSFNGKYKHRSRLKCWHEHKLVWTCCREHPVDWEAPAHPLAKREPRRGRRAALAATLHTPAGPLLVYNLHLEARQLRPVKAGPL